MQLDFEILKNGASARRFRNMTFPSYRHWLNFANDVPEPIAIGVVADGWPVALGMVAPGEVPNSGELLSLFVSADRRRQGIAAQLLAHTETACVQRGVDRVTARYMIEQNTVSALECALRKAGWGEPQTRMLVVRCSLDSIKDAPWMKEYRLPHGYEIIPWVDVTAFERAHITETHRQTPWIAPDLVPFDFEAQSEPLTSVALRVNGQILGWCLNHVVDGILRYTCSFVRRDLQRLGRIVLLYNESVARMPRAGLSVGSWTVPLEHPSMASFARRHMQPYAIFFGETRGIEKRI